jgi:DNA-binding transcriptional LysR family regulator
VTATIEHMSLLPVFLEVVRRGSFTAAAKALGLPKSTISRRVAELERSLGVALLARTTRSVRATEAGHELFESASAALERLEDATLAITNRQRVPRGTLRITAPSDGGNRFMSETIASFLARYPEVRVELVLTQRVVDLIDEGFDAAIRASVRLPDSSLVARRLSSSDLALFASHAYLARKGEPATLADLAQHDCVVFRPSRSTRHMRFEGPDGEEEIEMRGPVTVDDFGMVRELVRAGVGIGLIPSLLLPECSEGVKRVLPDYAMRGSSLYFVYPSARQVPAKVAAFRDHLVEAYAADNTLRSLR